MSITGSCLCGTLKYEIEGPFTMMMSCHCSMCRKHHGAPFATFAGAPLASFRWISGENEMKSFASSSNGKRSFCGTCGSHLYAHAAVDNPTSYGLRVGSLREREALVPHKRIWCRSALGWSQDLGGMAELERE